MGERYRNRSDEELMALYQSGDYDAFECLYKRHSGRVFEYLKGKVSDQAAAQDLLQETFMKVHRSRDLYSSQYPFLPWLFAISRNAVVDFFKSYATRLSQITISNDQMIERLPANSTNLVPTSQHDLASALSSLPVMQKRAIELRYLQDWSFEQIAEDMNTTPENGRQIVSRGIKKIRSFFKGGNK